MVSNHKELGVRYFHELVVRKPLPAVITDDEGIPEIFIIYLFWHAVDLEDIAVFGLNLTPFCPGEPPMRRGC